MSHELTYTFGSIFCPFEEDVTLPTIDTQRLEALFAKLLGIEGDLREIKSDTRHLTKGVDDIKEQFKDHDKRLRALESQRNWLMGAFAALSAALAMLWRYVELNFKR